MRPGKTFVFVVIYWLFATGLMLFSNWQNAQDHIQIALIRHGYFGFLSLGLSAALLVLYRTQYFSSQKFRLAAIVIFSLIAAIIIALIVNPITYLMIDTKLYLTPYRILSTDTLYYALLFLVWSLLYFQLFASQSTNRAETVTLKPVVFTVEKLGQINKVSTDDICCILANADYVELLTVDNSFMLKDTLKNVEEKVGALFVRIHRSTLVNPLHIKSISKRNSGIYMLELKGGRCVTSSRSYKLNTDSLNPSP